jgi:nucleoside-diphosphate-sugar epimerase
MRSNIDSPVNIGTKDLVSINDLVNMIASIEKVTIKKVHQLHKAQGVRGRNCDTSKAKKVLGWERKIPLNEGLRRINLFVHQELEK